MLRTLSAALAVAVMLSLAPAAQAAPADKPAAATQKPIVHKKHHGTRHWHGYGFLPRYPPPPPVAHLRLPARLPPARGDRARAGGALLGQWPALLRAGLAALLPRALE